MLLLGNQPDSKHFETGRFSIFRIMKRRILRNQFIPIKTKGRLPETAILNAHWAGIPTKKQVSD